MYLTNLREAIFAVVNSWLRIIVPKSILNNRKLRKFLFNASSPKKNKHSPRPNHNASISVDEIVEKQSYKLINLAGYAILALVCLDYAAMFFPPQFFNPNWELQTIGRATETVWGPLLGLILVFYRRQQYPLKRSELKILTLLSRLALILGIVYFLAAPLLITDTFRIMRTNRAQITMQLENQNKQVEQVTQQINQANDARLLNTFWQKNKEQYPNIVGISSPEIKQEILKKIRARKAEK